MHPLTHLDPFIGGRLPNKSVFGSCIGVLCYQNRVKEKKTEGQCYSRFKLNQIESKCFVATFNSILKGFIDGVLFLSFILWGWNKMVERVKGEINSCFMTNPTTPIYNIKSTLRIWQNFLYSQSFFSSLDCTSCHAGSGAPSSNYVSIEDCHLLPWNLIWKLLKAAPLKALIEDQFFKLNLNKIVGL